MRGFCCVLVLLCLMLPARAEVCLRVIGADDSPKAQAEKLLVRDAVLEALPDDARLLPAALPRINAAANEIAPCTLSIALYSPDEKIPRRPTLIIRVRQAEGHNWFGLIYQDSYALFSSGTGERTFRFPFLAWLFRM